MIEYENNLREMSREHLFIELQHLHVKLAIAFYMENVSEYMNDLKWKIEKVSSYLVS